MTNLTPYDRGEVLEPHVWVSDTDQARDRAHGTDGSRYGKVDFDNDTSITHFTVWAERQDDGHYVIKIQPLMDDCFSVEVLDV